MRPQDGTLFDAARQMCYHFFSTVLSDPRSEGWKRVDHPDYRKAVLSAAGWVRETAKRFSGDLAPGERPPETLNLEEPLGLIGADRGRLEAEYQRIFGFLLARDCPPCETEYCPQTFSVYRSQRLGDVAGYYRAFGLEPSRRLPERHDHISLEMEFMAWLIGKARYADLREGVESEEKAAVCRRAQGRFFEEHLCWWVPAFALALRKKAEGNTADRSRPRSFYGAVGCALPAFVAFERWYLGVDAPRELVAPVPLDEPEEMGCEGCALTGLIVQPPDVG